MAFHPYLIDRKKYCSRECLYSCPERKKTVSDKLKGRTVNPHTLFTKGHRQSEETRIKMSLAKIGKIAVNKGKTLSEETKKKISENRKGRGLGRVTHFKKGVPSWNKGIGNKTSEAKKIRTSIPYKEWRISVFQRDNYTCKICTKKGGKLNADHIKPFSLYPELRLDINNGRTLCIDCHKNTPTYGNRKTRHIA